MHVERNRRNFEAGVLGLAGPLQAWVQVRVVRLRPFRGHDVIVAGDKPDRGIIGTLLVRVLVLLDGSTLFVAARAGGARSRHK